MPDHPEVLIIGGGVIAAFVPVQLSVVGMFGLLVLLAMERDMVESQGGGPSHEHKQTHQSA
jgi:hypothetical protein